MSFPVLFLQIHMCRLYLNSVFLKYFCFNFFSLFKEFWMNVSDYLIQLTTRDCHQHSLSCLNLCDSLVVNWGDSEWILSRQSYEEEMFFIKERFSNILSCFSMVALFSQASYIMISLSDSFWKLKCSLFFRDCWLDRVTHIMWCLSIVPFS